MTPESPDSPDSLESPFIRITRSYAFQRYEPAHHRIMCISRCDEYDKNKDYDRDYDENKVIIVIMMIMTLMRTTKTDCVGGTLRTSLSQPAAAAHRPGQTHTFGF